MTTQRKDTRFATCHLHLYQPPREDPFTGVIDQQPSAAPYHDWNARITDECYHRLGGARILGDNGRVERILNLYGASGISFNVGPTLLSWMAEFSPATLAAIVHGDRLSRKRNNGHGNAIAQVWNHAIMPLASQRDKETQVVWAIKGFQHYYGRKPEGMWLAETAVDTPTLETLAANGISFTILAPRQAKRWRALDADKWEEGGIDPTRPYLCRLPSGKTIALFFYDGPISQAVAFEGLLHSGQKYRDRVLSGFNDSRQHVQHFTIGTDGESYGHHHRHGEMCLAWVIDNLSTNPDVTLTNYANFLELHPPQVEVEIHESSSWSCAHGVERWRSNCGCNFGEGQQAWRQPMREGFNTLRDRLAAIYESEGGKLFTDPWAARNDYIEVMLSPAGVDAFLAKHLRDQSQAASVRQRALALLEMQKFGMYSFTSCAWFFDHMDGIEPVQNMRYAARAIQLADELVDGEGGKLEEELLVTLARGQSKSGSGRDIWNNQVRKLAVARQLEGILSARLNEPVRVRKVTALVATARALKIPFDVNRAQEQLLAAYAAEVEMAGETPLAAELVTAYQEAAGSLELASGLLGWNEAGFDIRHRRSLSRRPTTPREVSMSARRRTHAGWRQ